LLFDFHFCFVCLCSTAAPTVIESPDAKIFFYTQTLVIIGQGFEEPITNNIVFVYLNNILLTQVVPQDAPASTTQSLVIELPVEVVLNVTGGLAVKVNSFGGDSGMAIIGVVQKAPGPTGEGVLAPGQIGGIVGGVIAALIVLAIIIVVVVKIQLKRIKDIKSRESSLVLWFDLTLFGFVSTFSLIKTTVCFDLVHFIITVVEVSEENMHLFNIKSQDLEIIHKLGEGSYGAVYFGKYKKQHVAIKRLMGSMISANVSDVCTLTLAPSRSNQPSNCFAAAFAFGSQFFREAALMLTIKNHRNIVNVFGMCQELVRISCFVFVSSLFYVWWKSYEPRRAWLKM
jgi:hypothetical protein